MRKILVAGAVLIASASPNPAMGQAQRGGGSAGASQQLVQQYQQLSVERTSLKADNERLKKEADDAKAQLAALTKEREALKARSGGAAAELERLKQSGAASEQALADTRRKLDTLLAKQKETIGVLEIVESDKAHLKQELHKTNQALDVCAVKNVGLYDLNNEVLTRWEHEGFWSRMAHSDGFTRVKRNELENLVDDYRARAAELKLRQAAPGGVPGAPAAESRQRQ